MPSRARLLVALGCALACDAAPAKPVGHGLDVAEPTEALRPEGQRGRVPEEAHVVDYAIEARLDADAHTVEGRERITWRNRSGRPTDVLPMHLYMNGFRAEDTAWMREGRGSHRASSQTIDNAWGYCDVKSVKLVREGQDAQVLAWAEGEDPSVMTVQLPEPVAPGQSIELDLEFTTLFPHVFARTGFHDGFHLGGQWFPKIGVLTRDGVWKNHVFTFHSEFFADFGDYRVELDVPAAMVVGATGIQVDEQIEGERKVVTYEARMVHDFAWTAWEDFVEHRSVHDGIRIRQLLPPDRFGEAEYHREAQVEALKSMEARFGAYPWSTITIVLPPEGAEGAGGMEYPTFYTTSRRLDRPEWAARLGFDERGSGVFTTVHEFGHQYFQGLLASDEHAQPWLDEGMNTFSNVMALYDWHGADPWIVKIAGNEVSVSDLMRLDTARGRGVLLVDTAADAFHRAEGLYSLAAYRKTAATMMTLRNLAGAERFDEALRTYADRHRFGHPEGADLERTLVEVIGATVPLAEPSDELPGSVAVDLDVKSFLEQALRTTDEVEFAVRDIHNVVAPADAGWHRDESGALVGGAAPDATPLEQREASEFDGYVVVGRSGAFAVPVEIEVELDDGSRRRVWWDGREATTVVAFPGHRVVRAAVDPDGLLVLETRRLDNHRYAERPPRDEGPASDLEELGQALVLSVLAGVGP